MDDRLLLLQENNAQPIVLERFPALVGRAEWSAVRLNDPWVSRRHCEIHRIDGQFVVRDLGSKYGILVNGRATDQSQLRPGDCLTVGMNTLRVVSELKDTDTAGDHAALAGAAGPPR